MIEEQRPKTPDFKPYRPSNDDRELSIVRMAALGVVVVVLLGIASGVAYLIWRYT